MNTIFVFLSLAALSQAQPGCFSSCGLGPGIDVCSTGTVVVPPGQPIVVRPQPIPKPPPPTISIPAPPIKIPLPSNPLGGPCFCRKPVVKPAVPAKPVCNPYYRKVVSSSNAINQKNEQQIVETIGSYPLPCGGAAPLPVYGPYSSGAYSSGAYASYPVPEAKAQYAPADPVSIAIAYNLAKKAQNYKEDILSFGFRQMPKEVPIQIKKVNNIPEENLYGLNGAIVELKPVAAAPQSVDEEAAEQLLDLQEEETYGDAGLRKISLGEIGYGLAKVAPTATYVNVAPSPFKPLVCKDSSFTPGQVIIQQIPKHETVVLPPELPEPCPDYPPKYEVPEDDHPSTCGCYKCYSSKRRATSKRTQSGEVFIEKLGCSRDIFN